ncbi:hypothetical protein OIO90_003202 [Microbotryomycetes sp. JL221]|nr:hypothetical protein OIO90_003202 [Microbotryomycetes sp. JL221]
MSNHSSTPPSTAMDEKKQDNMDRLKDGMGVSHKEQADEAADSPAQLGIGKDNVNARLDNPLAGISYERLAEMGRAYARNHEMTEYEDEFARGACVAKDPLAYREISILNDDDRRVLEREVTHKWDQPKTMYALVILCSVAAAVQGMDESVTNGATLFWPVTLGLDENGTGEWLLGLTNGAPSFTNTWWHLFIARFFLGIGIGPKSATTPVYGAETAPPLIRGALVMQWQVWTAFGIMMGTVSSLAFYKVPDSSGIEGLNWRIMLASAGVPAIALFSMVYLLPESPRWLVSKGRHHEAFKSLVRLRHTKMQAARDLFMIHALLEEEAAIHTGRPAIIELFAVPRNRRGALAAGIVMFMQQFCGINVIAYYSSTVFREAGSSEISALGATLGFGALNWLFALPGFFTIDTFGRRTLLLVTFPLMCIFLLMVGMGFFIPAESKARLAVVALGIYLHCMAYSPGEGPVPFTYSAEAFPLYVRETGMSLATAITWFFNFVLALTFPRLLTAFQPQGAFGFYAAWCAVGFVLVLLFVPETKQLTLEELDQVFSVPTKKHALYQLRQVPYFIKRYILGRKDTPKEYLYGWEGASGPATTTARSRDPEQKA